MEDSDPISSPQESLSPGGARGNTARESDRIQLVAGSHRFLFPGPAVIMGILNVTPDSFSDGGRYSDPDRAVDRALEMESQGAGMIDIGGESTRPNAVPVPEAEELKRVMPVIERLAGKLSVPISIDTMKPAVAMEAVRAGVQVINDVAAGRHGRRIYELAAENGCAYVSMHMKGTPQTMQKGPSYGNVVAEVEDFLRDHLKELDGCGVRLEQIIIDPGIGFGKRAEHNIQLLAGLNRFKKLGRPILVGVSRKSFLGKSSGAAPESRLSAGLACACLAVESGAHIIRTHDVFETVQAIRMTESILAEREAMTAKKEI